MYDGVVSYIDSNMSAVADNIARLCVCKAYTISYTAESAGAVRKTYTEVCVNTHNETGAVSTVGQACTTVYIRIADELGCKTSNCISGRTSAAISDLNGRIGLDP